MPAAARALQQICHSSRTTHAHNQLTSYFFIDSVTLLLSQPRKRLEIQPKTAGWEMPAFAWSHAQLATVQDHEHDLHLLRKSSTKLHGR